mmetsp:Transcript_35638/g.89433  ORF Transcript_35638/g.89433 Transcript_35638/m.89433 type:complete len:80 (+) Transcript_35638:59-298(+)|eukprot:7070732-Prymnesium_polylepis.1
MARERAGVRAETALRVAHRTPSRTQRGERGAGLLWMDRPVSYRSRALVTSGRRTITALCAHVSRVEERESCGGEAEDSF